jgi:hypothetical protein
MTTVEQYRPRSSIQPRAPIAPAPFEELPTITLTQLPRTVNLEIYRGDDFGMRLVLNDDEGNPADLAGGDVHAQLRVTHDSIDTLGEFVTEIEDNVISMRLPALVTAWLPLDAVWDVELTQHDWVTTLVAGTVKTQPDVTRTFTTP